MTENEFEKTLYAEMSEQQNTAVRLYRERFCCLPYPQRKDDRAYNKAGYMINCCGISPSEILAVTYTRAATLELKKRFADRFGSECGAGLENKNNKRSVRQDHRVFLTVYTDENVPHLMSRRATVNG